MPRVIISSGHTSNEPGVTANGLREYDLARKIASGIPKHLRPAGVLALSVPPGLDLKQRLEWINKTGYEESMDDIAIEIHINDGNKRGVEIWYEGDGNNKSEKLAKDILDHVTKESGLPSQGSKSEYDHELGSISFLHDANPITCLIECGYIDNKDDAEFLKQDTNLEKLSKGIADGIITFYGLEKSALEQLQTSRPATPVKLPPAMPPAPPRPIQVPNPALGGSMPQNNFDFDDNFDFTPNTGGNFGNMPGNYGTGMPNSPMPSREDRKTMIIKNYTKILGREPNQNDLNYFLNIGIKEDDLLKKMVDSQEHADLVKARQEVIETKKQLTEEQSELANLRALTSDQEKIIRNLQQSVYQKNLALVQLQNKINALIQEQQALRQSQTAAKKPAGQAAYRGTFLDKLFQAFSDLFE